MNKFDQYVKHRLKAKYYIRYADDFVFFSHNRADLVNILSQAGLFLEEKLRLDLHPDKVSIESNSSGIDFLGWVNFFDHRVLRAKTKKRMFKNIRRKEGKKETIQSYFGLLSHGNGHKLMYRILMDFSHI
jgi:hypothetical protein